MKFMIVAATLAVCLCLSTAAPLTEEVENIVPAAEENYRLITDIEPINYNVSLKPYLLDSDPSEKRFTFDGEAYITIKPKVTTSTLVLHSKNLKYSLREFYAKSKPDVKTTLPAVEPNNVTDIVTYTLTSALVANQEYVLHFVYTGTMDDDMHGFYRSSYTDSKNNTKWLGSTQFQTNHARRAFPSFDEPRFKATFDITLTRHKSMKTYSNTRIVNSTTNGDYVTDRYATTPKMSTYILAFIVSEFNERFNGDFGVIARPEFYKQTEYAFDVGQEILKDLGDYFDIPYYSMGNDKMHMAAIPDFSAGAMENWGLLTYRERALLYDEGSTTLSAQQYIAAVVAHEQAHMWFGDLVTCQWWSYTWLNEGFARYFQYFGTHNVETHYQMDQQFVVDQIQAVMNMDSTVNTNPMSDENTNTPADLSRMFNSISYNKGGTFIRMVKYVMGEENFKNSLREYLKTHQYTNTVPSDLFTVWKKYIPAQFQSYADGLFKSFTEQVGYPVITFNLTTPTTLVISQKRFLLKEGDGADGSLLYTVPITYTTNVENNFNLTTPKLFVTPNDTSVEQTLPQAVSWIVGNVQETGYYRVNYDVKSWHGIHHALLTNNWGGIHELNRAQVVDDLFNLARASVIDYDLALDILAYLKTETNYLPWTAAFNGYNYLVIRLGLDTKNFAVYIRDMTSKAYDFLGFEDKPTDTTLDIYNRAKILSWACKFGKKECITKAQEYFKNLDNKPVPVNIRSAVYCTAMREGTEADFNKLYNKYLTETVATEVTLILNSLGCVKDSKLVSKFFHIIVSDSVRRQDKSAALSSLYSENNENVEPVFDLVAENLDALANSMGGYSSVASVISNIASRFTTAQQETKLKNFNTQNRGKFGSSASTLDSAEKTVKENLDWAEKKLGTFKSHLDKYTTGGSASLSGFTALSMVLFAVLARFLC
ncbi:membrane alanyl aminopeptidase [Musca domestica]|uniref:Aminopeptidase n=1 Tax=Musca domestica TaxID=7370 RepID=A0ABM3UPY2_MUSDO|nr:membrane alanyl aminopeptidase [Musca domestica]XP_058975549.1 membrane alanyl aminopeptidase [Musca domestica]XP_058975559.1 membrane alanyl aminopeptidase [Musca domestica]